MQALPEATMFFINGFDPVTTIDNPPNPFAPFEYIQDSACGGGERDSLGTAVGTTAVHTQSRTFELWRQCESSHFAVSYGVFIYLGL